MASKSIAVPPNTQDSKQPPVFTEVRLSGCNGYTATLLIYAKIQFNFNFHNF
jgi:hypothetical protein